MEISNDSMNDSDFFQISMTSVSFVSSSLTTGISLLSLSDKSAVDVVGDLDGLRYWVILLFVRHPAACGVGLDVCCMVCCYDCDSDSGGD